MRSGIAGLGACVVLACSPLHAAGEDVVATLLGHEITGVDIADPSDGASPVPRLFERIWLPLSRHYIDENGLAATKAELGEAAAYHREFDRKDRDQRARKLQELEERLAGEGIEARERAWLEEFRAVLQRLARRDAEIDLEPPLDPSREAGQLAPWIETWKLNRAIYERYGGVVALTRLGPDPRGARAALIADYERRGLLEFADAVLRARLFEWLEAPPSMPIPPGDVDFTPYWRRTIPPSYFPD